MKKWLMLFLCALLTLLPLGATAESLPEVLGAVSQGLTEGLTEGLEKVAQFPGQDLSLTLTAEDTRIEEGRTLLLTITAGNPYPAAADVTLTLELPERLSCAQPLTWQAQLAPAQADPETGALVPSETAFTRKVTLTPDSGESGQAEVQVEMGMGARFYRATAALELCVPVIAASASLEGAQDGLIQPGKPFALTIDLSNEGTAPKDVPFTLALPEGVSPDGGLPEGVVLRERTLLGTLRAEAGSSVSLRLPLLTDEALLDGDADASRLIAAVLTVDGERVPAPMLRVVGPMISVKLIPEHDSLEEGRTMDLAITVVNTGLAAADVELSCLLPEGLSVIDAPKAAAAKKAAPAATEDEADDLPPAALAEGPGDPPAAAAEPVMSEAAHAPLPRTEDGALVYTVHMEAAKETEGGIAAATKEILLRVRADAPLDDVGERMLGASLVWRTNDGGTHMSEAAALRVYHDGFLGLSSSEWNGILLAALLMLVTVCCLYSAVKTDKQDNYCFE